MTKERIPFALAQLLAVAVLAVRTQDDTATTDAEASEALNMLGESALRYSAAVTHRNPTKIAKPEQTELLEAKPKRERKPREKKELVVRDLSGRDITEEYLKRDAERDADENHIPGLS